MKAIVLFLLAALPAQLPPTVKVQNISPGPLKQWVLCGLPNAVPAQSLTAGGFPAYASGHELHVFADLAAASERTLTLAEGPALPPLRLHPDVADDIWGLVPQFALVVDGEKQTATPTISIDEVTPVLLRVSFRALIPRANVTIDAWARIYADSPIVEFETNATYGTTATGQPRLRTFGSLTMTLREFAAVDFATPKGLRAPVWSTEGGTLRWEVELAAPMQWHRASTIDCFGAILCLPQADRFAASATENAGPAGPGAVSPDVTKILSRATAPLTSMVDPAAWAGKYGPLGVIPKAGSWAPAEQTRRWNAMWSKLRTPGSELDPRAYAQPPNSGQTGEQAEFGWARCEHAISMWAPWALWDLRYHVQAWKLRPLANKEPDGSRVLASRHPNARTYNLRPDERFSRADMLGWPNPVGWISGWTTPDSQHRSVPLLMGLYQLTRSPSLRTSILDLIELERMAYSTGMPPPGSGLGAPRAWGRVLYSRLWGIVAGFPEFEPLVRSQIIEAAVAASYTTLPPGSAQTVRVLSSNEEKYGWKTPEGQMIRCWLPWQESIAVVAFYAAWKQLSIPEARTLALTAARTTTKHAYFKSGTNWYVCYGVRWRTDAPGEPLPDSAYNLSQPNYDIFVYGMHRWTNPALRVFLALDPQAPEAARATEILAFYGEARGWEDACWWAVN